MAATDTPTVPLAEPDEPLEIAIQFAALAAVHRQPVSVVTPTASAPPSAAIVSFGRDNEKTHGAGCWLTATLCPATTIAAERAAGAGFAATEIATVASPWPVRAPAMETHAASVATDHVQSRVVLIVTDPCPPGGGNDGGVVVADTWQRLLAASGAVIDVSVWLHAAAKNAPAAAASAAMANRCRQRISFPGDRIANASPARLTDEVGVAAATISPMTLDEAQRLASRLRDELGRAIIGQQAAVHDILTAFFAGGHCLLRGVPGLAETLLIKTLAQAIHLKFNRIQFTPDLMPSRV